MLDNSPCTLRSSFPMLPVIERLFSIPWIYCLTRIRYLWRLACIFRRGPPSPFNLKPLTDQQCKLKGDEFIDLIDTDAIRALASKHNGGLSCSIRCRRQGSFNVCFILDFPDCTTRLVRLPIEPAVHDVWDKVRSEVYTMQCFGIVQKTAGASFSGKLSICLPNYEGSNSLEEAR
ncbi:Uncharacterized protein TPAR_03792 [Tolypocladium paradoxum]|uniref:Uncharacterized protein n=1 Tax=Tolypocladium paradoxum TaxID=94208 RepID=A0A2S4L0K2_9HYPO|nr:Uncharacterized protein TPAR_03792 [Tolypocladium paradoxum]